MNSTNISMAPAHGLDRHWIKLLGAVLIAQIVYWGFYQPSERPDLSGFIQIDSVAVAALPEPSLAAVAALPEHAWQNVTPHWYTCCDNAYHAFKYTFDLTSVPDQDLGLIAGFGADNYHLWVNGYPLVTEGRLAPTATYHSRWVRGIERVSTAMLKPGANEVTVITARNEGGYTDLFWQSVGDYLTLQQKTKKRTFMVGEYRVMVMVVIGIIALLAAILVPVTHNRAFAFWLAVLCGGLALRIGYQRWADPPMSPSWFTIYYFAIASLVPLAWFNFLDAWTGRGWPRVRVGLTVVYAVIVIICAAAILQNKSRGYDLASDLTHYFYIIVGLSAAGVFLKRMLSMRTDRYFEAALFTVGVCAMLVDAVYELLYDQAEGNLFGVLPFLIVGLVAAILARNVRVYESMGAFNEDLNQTLISREREIEQRYAELHEAERARDLAVERQRILRDMHDGVGGQLTSLLLQTRTGSAAPQEIHDSIEACLNDLRLVIESLDEHNATFDGAMQTFRARLQHQMLGTKIELDWRLGTYPNLRFTPTEVLQVLRVLQEAVTNVMRHANATTLTITAISSDPAQLTLVVRDNGGGVPEGTERGRGMHNMRRRAGTLNGSISFATLPDGYEVRLTLPIAGTGVVTG